MTKLVAKLKTSRSAYKLDIKDKLSLPYAARRLPKGETLHNGDLATGEDGHIYEVAAQAEKLLHIEVPAPKEAATVAYLLGNGHVPVQIGKGFLRVVHRPDLADMMRQLGVAASEVDAPFEPDLAAPAHHHHHDHDHDHDHDH